jgi:murein DD-endopeptidase MepM/ murein hydrolase activator NlpD
MRMHPPARRTPAARPSVALSLAALVALGGCEFSRESSTPKQDTATAPALPAPVGTPSVGDTGAMAGVPAVPVDSAQLAAADTGALRLHPARPRRGGVLFAFADGIGTPAPRCSWKGAALPCHRSGQGVLAIVPLPADEPGGTFTLTIDRPGGRIARQITVEEHDFGRELIFLDSTRYRLVRQGTAVARDARALRAVLAQESADRRWTGAWREPSTAKESGGYGVERFYYPASDSSRAITLSPSMRSRGTFGGDTGTLGGRDVPGWRHAGLDIGAARRTPVTAPAGAQVADVGDYVLTGRTLVLDHGQGVMSAYFHLDTVLVRRGDMVRPGATVARVGSTGLSTGPHLHWGVYVHGRDVDPTLWRDMPEWARSGGT